MSDDKTENKNEKDNGEEIERVFKDITTHKYCKTSILHNLKFESKLDEFIFSSLPLSNSQKEKLLIDIYSLDKKI
jgi:hypothetical protein